MYVIDHSKQPPSCLPEGLDSVNLVDVTTIGDSWRRYVDTDTGRIYDGAVYYQQMLAEQSPPERAK